MDAVRTRHMSYRAEWRALGATLVGRTMVERRGRDPEFVDGLVKVPGRWKPSEFPDALEPIASDSLFVARTRARSGRAAKRAAATAAVGREP
jgi:hypothetical protein